MGYASTNIAIFGVEVDYDDVKKIYAELATRLKDYDPNEGDEEWAVAENFHKLLGIPDEEWDSWPCRFEIRSWAEGADSRIDLMHISKDGARNVFGIQMGSNGYAYEDDVSSLIKNPPEIAREIWDKYCEPLLKSLGIKHKAPDTTIVNQTW